MKISARVRSGASEHDAIVATNGAERRIAIPAKADGSGSSANGGELLFLALATCYCNDIYREAADRDIEVDEVEVEVDGQFGGPGDPATGVSYRARVVARAPEADIEELMRHTDAVAEIQNTLRGVTPVNLVAVEAIRAGS